MSGFSRRNLLRTAVGVIAAPLVSDAAMAQDVYPSRPIHLIVGFTPGTAADITARAFSNGAESVLGQTIVVEDKPGAGFERCRGIRRPRRQGRLHTFLIVAIDRHQPSHES
jgi:tripartite-type tricarboxylate transporter receptor subunit TctC